MSNSLFILFKYSINQWKKISIGSHMPEDELAPNLEQELSQYLSMPSSLHNSFLTDPFEMQELDKVIPSLSRRKSPGHDSLLNEHIYTWWTLCKIVDIGVI